MGLCVPGLGDPTRKAENSEGQREVEVGEQGCWSGRTSAERPDPGGTQAEAAPRMGCPLCYACFVFLLHFLSS